MKKQCPVAGIGSVITEEQHPQLYLFSPGWVQVGCVIPEIIYACPVAAILFVSVFPQASQVAVITPSAVQVAAVVVT